MAEIRAQINAVSKDMLSEAKTHLQICSVNLCTDDNVYFKSWKSRWAGLTISEAIQYSFSAAYYFGASVDPKKRAVYADGGEGNANCTLRESMIEAYLLGWRTEGFYILSVGTGYIDGRMPYAMASKMGHFGQTKKYINMARRQALRTQLKEARTVAKINPGFDFDRVDAMIDEKYDVLDGLAFSGQYTEYGHEMIKEWLPSGGSRILSRLLP